MESSSFVSPTSRSSSQTSFSKQGSINNKLPSYTEVHTVSPIAAGLPVLEIVRKLEEEKVINRNDRVYIKEALYSTDLKKRDDIIQVLNDIELSGQSKFTVRRLKCLLYGNGAGEISSKSVLKDSESSASVPMLGTTSNKSPSKNQLDRGYSYSKDSNSIVPSEVTQLPEGILTNQSKNGSLSSRQASSKYMASYLPSFVQSQYANNPATVSSTDNNSKNNSQITPMISPKPTQSAANNNISSQKTSSQSKLSKQTSNNTPVNNTNINNTPNLSNNNNNNNNTPNNHNNNFPPSNIFNDNMEEELHNEFDLQSSVNKVIGECPMYSHDSFNVLQKISSRLNDLQTKYDLKMLQSKQNRRLAIIVGSGSFNPLTRMHIRLFYLAKMYLEKKFGYIILGSLLSPAHAATVRERYRTNTSEIIPSPHRLSISQLLVSNSQWLSIDPWEITRRRPMDYLSLLEHVQSMVNETFPYHEIKIFYLCKANIIPLLSPIALKKEHFSVISVCRTLESDSLRNILTSKWNGLIHVVEDNAILDASLDIVTSRKVRDKIKAGESVEHLVGGKINEYILMHQLGPKVILIIIF